MRKRRLPRLPTLVRTRCLEALTRLVVVALAVAGGGLLFVGLAGPFLMTDPVQWTYRPDDFPFSRPQGRLYVGLGFSSLAVEWVSPCSSQTHRVSTETWLYEWLDVPLSDNAGGKHRCRLLYIRPLYSIEILVGSLLLLYPVYRVLRNRRARRTAQTRPGPERRWKHGHS